MRSRLTDDHAQELNGVSTEIESLISSLTAARGVERTAVDELAKRLSEVKRLVVSQASAGFARASACEQGDAGTVVPIFENGPPLETLPQVVEESLSALTRENVQNTSPSRRSDPFRLVYVSGEDLTPGHHYRVLRPMAAARTLGADTSWMKVADVPARLEEIAAADAVVFWRAAWDENVASGIDAARCGGTKIVFDVDDLMVDPELARVEVIDGIRTNNLAESLVQDHYTRVRRVMDAADLCTTTTDELAQHMRDALRPTIVLPNGFDHSTLSVSRLAARRRAAGPNDGLFRIGYASGSRTHQRDFAECAEAVAKVLREHHECRLVAFRCTDGVTSTLDIAEFAPLVGLEDRIEWRNLVPLDQLPEEVARFDINLAPLELGNPFCEAKSELKFFEAALVGVPTIASPTGPFRRAIRHGETGFLATTQGEWRDALTKLIVDPHLRRRVGAAALRDVLWSFGPERRLEEMALLLDLLRGGRAAARASELDVRRRRDPRQELPRVPEYETVFEVDHLRNAQVTVIMSLYDYAQYVGEALDSVAAQTLSDIDLVVVDNRSTDDSLTVALDWAKANADRFNRINILLNRVDTPLGPTRNIGFDVATTRFVLPLDADNRLLPECAAACLETAQRTGAAFAYPLIKRFGAEGGLMGGLTYDPVRLRNGNYIDAMALVSKAAWAAVGGIDHVQGGWEDFDFWCKLVERGLVGEQVPGGPFAEYRVHSSSMHRTANARPEVVHRMIEQLERRHPWLTIVWPLRDTAPPPRQPPASCNLRADEKDRLSHLLPILQCPETGLPLMLARECDTLVSEDRSRRWPIVQGRPLLFPGMEAPKINPDDHVSNALPENARELIRSTVGLVLHLSAGGTAERHDNVIEAEAAIFRHTDVLADVHHLPFADGSFAAVIALNAFEHYRDPRQAAREIFRVLQPGGRVLIRTAFLQPLHEAPWHFFNCTRYVLEAWFEDFATERLHVSDNFQAGYSLCRLTSECEDALRRCRSGDAANPLLAAPIERLVSMWRDPEYLRGNGSLWHELAALPQDAPESLAAGFEYLGRRP